MDAIISGAVLASLSGLTALAFKHPRAFAKLYLFLNVAATVLFLGLSIWQVAVQVTWTGIRPFLDQGQMDAAYLAKTHLVLPYLWICAAYGALLAFLWVNLKLPVFIRTTGAPSAADSKDS